MKVYATQIVLSANIVKQCFKGEGWTQEYLWWREWCRMRWRPFPGRTSTRCRPSTRVRRPEGCRRLAAEDTEMSSVHQRPILKPKKKQHMGRFIHRRKGPVLFFFLFFFLGGHTFWVRFTRIRIHCPNPRQRWKPRWGGGGGGGGGLGHFFLFSPRPKSVVWD